jgi:type I restriction enzyme M protein
VEAEGRGWDGRFGAGLPRISDGSMLFLQHMISKFKPLTDAVGVDGGSRMGIVLSGSPLFSGAAGSGESEIRRWIIEGDLLEGIVALPDQMFYNTGISTYVWILTNRKPANRRGMVVLVDARESGSKMRKSLGDKRKELTEDAISEISRLFTDALDTDDPRVKVMANQDFGFARLTVERPLRRVWEVDGVRLLSEKTAKAAIQKANPAAEPKAITALLKAAATTDPDADPVEAKSGGFEADADLRDQENIPLPAGYLTMDDAGQAAAVKAAADAHLAAEIHPYVPDAWIDHGKTKIGYEIPFTRQFYIYTPPRPVAEIRAEIDTLEAEIQDLMRGLA